MVMDPFTERGLASIEASCGHIVSAIYRKPHFTCPATKKLRYWHVILSLLHNCKDLTVPESQLFYAEFFDWRSWEILLLIVTVFQKGYRLIDGVITCSSLFKGDWKITWRLFRINTFKKASCLYSCGRWRQRTEHNQGFVPCIFSIMFFVFPHKNT